MNIGAGHAVTALSRLLFGRRIGLDIPELWRWQDAEELCASLGRERTGVALVVEIEDRAQFRRMGALVILLDNHAARFIPGLLLAGSEMPRELGVMEQSVLSEVATITANAWLGAIAAYTRLVLVPRPPSVEQGHIHEALERELARTTSLPLYAPSSTFAASDGAFGGRIIHLCSKGDAFQLARLLGVDLGS
jgi:chemotaxis protein CheY-P-specific phosphatase CheC